MKKLKVFLTGAMALAMMMPMAMTGVSAAEKTGDGDTDVVYDNTNVIPDPENPDNPNWGVSIPSSIQFTDKNKRVSADVELVAMNGATAAQATPNKDVVVTVKSADAYNLSLKGDKSTDKMKYNLIYDKTTMVGDAGAVKTFVNGTAPGTEAAKAPGEAVLTGTATKTGVHKDTLTYTVSVTVTP